MYATHRSILTLGILLALLNIAASCSTKHSEEALEEGADEGTVDMHTANPERKLMRRVPSLSDIDIPQDLSDSTELTVLLRDGDERRKQGSAEASAVTKGTPLAQSDTRALLARLTPIAERGDDKQAFAKRERSLPPPNKGDIVATAFPPAEELAPPDTSTSKEANAPLTILRHAPEGEVPVVPQVSVTFSQPMVAISSIAEINEDTLPVSLTPEVPGQWRWVGAKTLLFEPENERLPMATTYTLTVKDNITSKLGHALADDAPTSYAFATPPVKVTRFWPNSGRSMPRDQVMFMEFDQRVDREVMLDFIRLKSGMVFGGRSPVLASAEDLDDEELQQVIANAKQGRWIAFKADEEFPYNAHIEVTLKKGAPSSEGPRLTKESQAFGFETFGPMKIDEDRCGWGECTPQQAFIFRFSNELSTEQDIESLITVDPPFPGMAVSHYGNQIVLSGSKPGRRTYTVTFSEELLDRFEQKLDGKREFSFEVGAERPWVSGVGGHMLVLDPSSDPAYPLFSLNMAEVDVKIYAVDPEKHWGDYLEWMQTWGARAGKPPGELLLSKRVAIKGSPDEMTQTLIDLTPHLGKEGLGHLVLDILPTKAMEGSSLEAEEYRPRIKKWLQSTQLGLDALLDYEQLTAMATSLKGGEPVSDVTIRLTGSSLAAKKSDTQGMTTFALTTSAKEDNTLLAKKGDDVAMLPEYVWRSGSSSWSLRTPQDQIRIFTFDDRGMYNPGEEVHVKGFARLIEHTKGGGVGLPKGARAMNYKVRGPMGNELTSGTTDVTSLGGFDFAFTLPKTPNLGSASIELTIDGTSVYGAGYHTFQIQEFRRPEFEVSASAPEGPFVAGEDATVSVKASYYAGGALPGAETTWTVTTTQASYSPPNQSAYTFGSWTPWWSYRGGSPSSLTPVSKTYQGETNPAGEHMLTLEFGMSSPPRPVSVQAQASVQDVNRQVSTSSATLLVHPSMHYVGLRSDEYFVEQGTPLELDAIVSDIDGHIIEGRPLKVRAARVKYTWKNGTYSEELVDPQECEITTTNAASKCTFKTGIGGTYKITGMTLDDYGRPNFTEVTRWVSGGKSPTSRKVEQERVDMIPDRDTYQPGDKARVLVQAPFTPAEGLMTINRNGILEQKRFTLSEPTKTFEVPIKSSHVPNLHVRIDLVGSAPRLDESGEADESLPRRPAYATGQINLPVPPLERTLDVDIKPSVTRIEPGGQTDVEVRVTDASGDPVDNAEVAIVLVDESILALSNYAMSDPVAFFYTTRPDGVSSYHSRAYVSLIDPAKLRQQADSGQEASEGRESPKSSMKKKKARRRGSSLAPMAAAPPMAEMAMDTASDEMMAFGAIPGGGVAQGPIAIRSNFNPLAGFFPAVTTDTLGQAKISVKMPDNLTRYRVMAVAVDGGERFGESQSAITARLPLMVRPSAPRFLNFGDKFELPIVLQNQTDEPMDVQVAARATNVSLTSDQGYSVKVPANDRVEVRFPAITEMAGTARFQVAASAGSWQDAASFDLPVWTPATSEAFATYGVLDEGTVTQPVKTPGEVWPQFGQIDITTSSTAMQALTDAFLYLYTYRYECAEQIASRVLSVAALRDVLKAFNTDGMPSDAEIMRSMKRDMEKLAAMQNYDGGFGLWRAGQPSWPYVTLHTAHAITRAKSKGYDVSDIDERRMMRYLKDIENYIPSSYSKKTRHHISAYALYLRDLNSDRDTAKARALIKSASSLDAFTFESLGWLLSAMSGDPDSSAQLADIKRYLGNRVTETAGAAHFATSISEDQGYLIMHSDRVADAIILEALIEEEPKSDLIPKIVRGLLAHRKKGRWSNTQENAFVLLALDNYFAVYEKQTPNFVARVWLGDTYAGDHTFKGRTTEQHQIDIPMSYLTKMGGPAEKPLVIQRDGTKGRLYYRVGMTYAPKSLQLDPMDQGFVVERAYEPVDDDDDVKRLADGTWEIKAGAKVRIKLMMVAPTRRYHVALVDPLPAGLETLNPALATTEDIPQDPAMSTGRGWWWWSRPWFEHQNMRDERTEAFTTLLWGGVHRYTYYARATTPGEFVVPPTKAEEMYHPETFGRSGTDRVRVVD